MNGRDEYARKCDNGKKIGKEFFRTAQFQPEKQGRESATAPNPNDAVAATNCKDHDAPTIFGYLKILRIIDDGATAEEYFIDVT